MSDYRVQLKHGFYSGVRRGWRSFIWIMKITVPITFIVMLLQWSGWLYQLDFLLRPLMGLINLPAEAALPIIIGMLSNPYGTIAVMAVLPFTIEQMTLIAIFTVIAHALIMEGVVQGKAGTNAGKMILVRVVAATLAVLIVSQFFEGTAESIVTTDVIIRAPLGEIFKVWAIDTLILAAKILGIVMAIMIVLESLASLGWIKYLLRPLKPFMRVLGLSDKVTMWWVIAVIFGLTYGSAAIIDEMKKGGVTKEELDHFHISVGINHSMVEDPALFMALGLNGFWLLLPRLVMAIIVVQAFRSLKYLKKKVVTVLR